MVLYINDDSRRKKIYITEEQCNSLIESEWNFHFGGDDRFGYASKSGGGHDLRPHMSDNKFCMPGRDTGHFGSGTYFSTYMKGDYSNGADVSAYGNEFPDKDPHFIQVGDGVYRVDFDLYKNLYRVRTKRHGDVLFTMMESLNRFYNRICRNHARFDSSMAHYDNASLYQIIRRNAEGLGLRCPSYYQLTRMAQEHGRDDDAVQSFSTLFMEWNGYNGVNVSGVDYYDNTLHGSVIYDLSKVDTTMEQVDPMKLRLFTGLGDEPSHNNAVVMNGFDDPSGDALRGKYILWGDKLNGMPVPQAMRLLKNYTDSGHILSPFTIGKMNDELASRYLRLIYVKDPYIYTRSVIDDNFINGDNKKYYIRLIDKYGAYYWANYESSWYRSSMLIQLLDNFDSELSWNLSKEEIRKAKEEYLSKLMSYMTRELNEREREYINDDYFYNYDNDE